MSVNISYMGTKRELASTIADVISHGQTGPLLDVFSGMCSVAEEVGARRQIWANDIQIFSSEVAAALFTTSDEPLSLVLTADKHFTHFQTRVQKLNTLYSGALIAEDKLLESERFTTFTRRKNVLDKILSTEKKHSPRHSGNLFTRIYSDTFFGVRQAIEADAICYAIKTALQEGQISSDHRRWLLIGLGRALLRCSTSTGHFAQYLKPKPTSFKTYLRQRKRQIWTEWLASSEEMAPVGDMKWRKKNRSFNQDTLKLLPKIAATHDRPGVIYADPPYTDDQYSRFYHLLETLILYDYPTVTGAGLYRENRFQTPFSIKSKATAAIDGLIESAAKTGADLVLSYPTNGLVYEAGCDPLTLLKRHYRKVERCHALSHSHSTFGASKGEVRAKVIEQIYLARSS